MDKYKVKCFFSIKDACSYKDLPYNKEQLAKLELEIKARMDYTTADMIITDIQNEKYADAFKTINRFMTK